MLRSLNSTMPSACIELQQAALHLTSPKFHCITGQSGLSGTVRWVREVFSLAQPRHPGLDVARRGRQQLGAVTVALGRAGRGPLPMLRTDPGGQLRLVSIRRAAPRISPIDDANVPSTSVSRRASSDRAESCWAIMRLLVGSELRESHVGPPHFKRPAARSSYIMIRNSPQLDDANIEAAEVRWQPVAHSQHPVTGHRGPGKTRMAAC